MDYYEIAIQVGKKRYEELNSIIERIQENQSFSLKPKQIISREESVIFHWWAIEEKVWLELLEVPIYEYFDKLDVMEEDENGEVNINYAYKMIINDLGTDMVISKSNDSGECEFEEMGISKRIVF